MKKPCGTSPALSLQIRGSPFRRRANFFSQTPADHVLGDTSSFHLQLLRPLETDMLTVPHQVAQPGWQSACKPHSEKRLPAGSPHEGQQHRVLQPGPFRGPQLRARCADRHDERSCVSEWRWSFSLFIPKKSVTRRRGTVDSIHLSVIAYVDDVYLITIHHAMEGATWQTDSSGTNLSPTTWTRQSTSTGR